MSDLRVTAPGYVVVLPDGSLLEGEDGRPLWFPTWDMGSAWLVWRQVKFAPAWDDYSLRPDPRSEEKP